MRPTRAACRRRMRACRGSRPTTSAHWFHAAGRRSPKKKREQLLRAIAPAQANERAYHAQLVRRVLFPRLCAVAPIDELAPVALVGAHHQRRTEAAWRRPRARTRSRSRSGRSRRARRRPAGMRCRARRPLGEASRPGRAGIGRARPQDGPPRRPCLALLRCRSRRRSPSAPRSRPSTSASASASNPRD